MRKSVPGFAGLLAAAAGCQLAYLHLRLYIAVASQCRHQRFTPAGFVGSSSKRKHQFIQP